MTLTSSHSVSNAKYDENTRFKIRELIMEEFRKFQGNIENGDAFSEYMTRLLRERGFKAPTGDALSERTVRYQIYKAGVRFRPQAKPRGKDLPVAESKRNIPLAVKRFDEVQDSLALEILTSKEIDDSKRIELLRVYYGVTL